MLTLDVGSPIRGYQAGFVVHSLVASKSKVIG